MIKWFAALLLFSFAMFAQPIVEVMHFHYTLYDFGALRMSSEVRMLKIIAPAGATAFKVDLITTDAVGGRRTWSYVIPRAETRYGWGIDNRVYQSATFFTIPIDLDIPITDYWVTTLIESGEAFHLKK